MWTGIHENDLARVLSNPELDTIRTSSLGDMTPNQLLADTIDEVIQEVRGRVAAYDNNLLQEGDTVPPALKATALVLIRHKLWTRISGADMMLDEARMEEYRAAERRLSEVAAGRFAVDDTDKPTFQGGTYGGDVAIAL
jgi:hypothetical protein